MPLTKRENSKNDLAIIKNFEKEIKAVSADVKDLDNAIELVFNIMMITGLLIKKVPGIQEDSIKNFEDKRKQLVDHYNLYKQAKEEK